METTAAILRTEADRLTAAAEAATIALGNAEKYYAAAKHTFTTPAVQLAKLAEVNALRAEANRADTDARIARKLAFAAEAVHASEAARAEKRAARHAFHRFGA
jgi:hypothetical protein